MHYRQFLRTRKWCTELSIEVITGKLHHQNVLGNASEQSEACDGLFLRDESMFQV